MDDDNRHEVNRREFLVAGSLAAAGLAVANPVLAAPKSAAAVPLSIGFLSESATGSLQSASAVLSGDPTLFSRGARFSFRGMQSFPGDATQILIDLLYDTIAGVIPFYAFTHRESGRLVTNSSASSVLVSVPTTGTIDLAVKIRLASSAEAQTRVSFAVNSADNALKLNRGTYFFAFSDRVIDWSAVRLADGVQPSTFVSGGKPLLVRASGGQVVNFNYVVMTVAAGSMT